MVAMMIATGQLPGVGAVAHGGVDYNRKPQPRTRTCTTTPRCRFCRTTAASSTCLRPFGTTSADVGVCSGEGRVVHGLCTVLPLGHDEGMPGDGVHQRLGVAQGCAEAEAVASAAMTRR